MGPPFQREEGSDYYWSLPLYWESNSGEEGVRITLLLAVHRQTVRLGDKPLENHDQ
jgi:hypothetical protein